MSGRRVLIVEADAATRSELGNAFSRHGWNVAGAGSTAEGLMHLEPPPHCLVLDLMLPDRGGELLLWKVRSEKLPIRVIVTTATRDPARIEAVRRLRPDAFLEKPVDPDVVYRSCCGGPPQAGRIDIEASTAVARRRGDA